jgi:pSer/pThr/pTyr-binding forkhead associated (FHA) protein
VVAEGHVQFLIQRASGRGYVLVQVRKDALRIGRGTNAELRSENPAVALEHAIIELEAGGYVITDKGSITGTYVNRKPVESARLAKGDIIEIGDLRIDVQLVEPGKPLFLRVVPTEVRATDAADEQDEDITIAPATPGRAAVRAKKVDYISAYRLSRPWLTKLTLTALGLIVALGVIGEVIRPEKQKAFMPGGLSSAHSRARDTAGNVVAEQCSACHTPWKSVENAKCLTCHARPPHAMNELNPPDCFQCHAEHRGEMKLAANADERCTGCHANLRAHMKPNIELASLRYAGGRYTFPAIATIPAFGDSHPELVPPPDLDNIRFNHKLHLAQGGIFNATGRRETLQCINCHSLVTVKEKTDPVPLEFEKHCQRCHRLTFDAKLPDAEVPHGGDPNTAYGYIGYIYAGNRDLIGKPPDVVRRILATRQSVELGTRAQINGEQVIKTKCAKCHDIVRKGQQLIVNAPVIRRDWFDSVRFSHGTHANIDCERCHAGARTSVATSDVLMPSRKDCTVCHAKNAADTQDVSTCKTCHEYHLHTQKRVVMASLALQGPGGLGRGGRMLQGILLAVIVVLLLVVLVPVGIALVARLRPERSAPAPAPKPTVPVPPTSKVPAIKVEIPTDKVSRSDVPTSTPNPSPPSPKTIADTQLEKPLPQAATGGGTQMLEWYGLLKCTSGVLDGERFTIEEGGIYIGRDPALSQVVIPDTKISKRHVRIVPRDGKVWAIDEGSTNGTYVTGHSGRITEVQLKRGDTIILGDNTATFVYQI